MTNRQTDVASCFRRYVGVLPALVVLFFTHASAYATGCVGNELVNPITVYPWTRVVIYYDVYEARSMDDINTANTFIQYSFDNESSWSNVTAVSEGAGADGNTWRVKEHIPAPGRSAADVDFTYSGDGLDTQDWRDSNYDMTYDNNANNVDWSTDGGYHIAASTVDGQSYAYVTKSGEDSSTTTFADADTAVLRCRAFKEDITSIALRHTGNFGGTAMAYIPGADYNDESDYNNSYTVEFWDTQISGDEWTTAINAGGSGNFVYSFGYTDGSDVDYLKSAGMVGNSGDGTDFTLTVTDDDSAAPILVGTEGTEDTNGYMRILLKGVDKRTAGTGKGTKTFTLTDGDLRSLSGTNKLTFKFAAYDETSGLQRGSVGTASTNMNYDIGEVVGFLQDIFATYVSGSSSAGTSASTAQWSVFEHSTAFSKDEVTQLYTNSASGTQGKNRIRISVPDADSDRVGDQKWVTDTQVGFLKVEDDDGTAPTLCTIKSPEYGALRNMQISIGGSAVSQTGSSTNLIFTTTDNALAAVAGDNQLIMRFGAVDADSGLARNAAGPADDSMNLDIGQIVTDNYAQYDAGISSTYEETRNVRATNAWTWSSAFTGAQISNLVTSAPDGIGTNKLTLSIPDADDDRNNDRLTVVNQQYGYLVVNDDDPTPPTLANATFFGKKLQIDISDGSGVYDPGSGSERLYMIYDDDGNVDDGVDGTIDLSPIAGDTYQADSDLSYANMDGKLVTYRVYAYDNDAEHTYDRAQGIYNGSNLWELNAPVAATACSTNSTGFNANWSAATGADDYRLDVSLSPVFDSALDDDFEDGDLTGWTQSTAGRFEASTDSPLSGSVSLHHVYNNTSASHDQIAFSTDGLDLTAATTTWRFQAKHTYNPSSGNNWGVFLISDLGAAEMYPSGTADGYVVGVDYASTGTDDNLQIWKITGGSGSLVLDTGLNWQTDVTTANQAGIEVTRTAAGAWSVKVDANGGFDSLVTQGGSASNADHTNTAYTGIYYEYTSTVDQKLWIDDISITQPGMYVTGYSNKTVTGTSSAVSGLSASTTYYYRLRAASSGGALSDNSNVITVTTTADSTGPTGSVFRFR